MSVDQRAADTELEERLLWALRRARKLGLPEDDLRTLCYGAGIDFKHVMGERSNGTLYVSRER